MKCSRTSRSKQGVSTFSVLGAKWYEAVSLLAFPRIIKFPGKSSTTDTSARISSLSRDSVVHTSLSTKAIANRNRQLSSLSKHKSVSQLIGTHSLSNKTCHSSMQVPHGFSAYLEVNGSSFFFFPSFYMSPWTHLSHAL